MNNFEKLTENELKELKGALYALDMIADDDLLNRNLNPGCYCQYKDHSVIRNVNSSTGCMCVCS